MDYLYRLFSDSNSQAIETHSKVIYKQVSSCCEDVSVTKSKARNVHTRPADVASVPILRQNAGVTLVILNTVKVQLLLFWNI